MQSSKPFLSPETRKNERPCILCNGVIGAKEKSQKLGDKGWANFKADAKTWSMINIPIYEPKHRFTELYEKIKDMNMASGEVHKKCRTVASNSGRYIQNYGMIDKDAQEIENISATNSNVAPIDTEVRTARKLSQVKRHCFVCDSERDSNNNKYNEGGLGCCSVESAQTGLIERKNIYMKDLSHRFYQASKHLDILSSSQSHNIFAVDVFYHQWCYIKFALALPLFFLMSFWKT